MNDPVICAECHKVYHTEECGRRPGRIARPSPSGNVSNWGTDRLLREQMRRMQEIREQLCGQNLPLPPRRITATMVDSTRDALRYMLPRSLALQTMGRATPNLSWKPLSVRMAFAEEATWFDWGVTCWHPWPAGQRWMVCFAGTPGLVFEGTCRNGQTEWHVLTPPPRAC